MKYNQYEVSFGSHPPEQNLCSAKLAKLPKLATSSSLYGKYFLAQKISVELFVQSAVLPNALKKEMPTHL